MVTRWKNINKKIREWLQRDTAKMFFFVAGAVSGGYLLITIWDNQQMLITQETLLYGLLANVLLGIAVINGLRYWLKKKYCNDNLLSDQFYDEWKMQFHLQQKCILIFSAIAVLFIIFYFTYMLREWWKFNNYSSGYIFAATVLIQGIIVESIIVTFMQKRLAAHLKKLNEINKENLEKAIRSEKMKVDLISNVSHDLKTPLTSMVGYIELMKKEELSDILKDYTQVLGNKAQKLKEMIESLFSLAKTSSGNIELDMEPMELNVLVEQVQADMEDIIKVCKNDIVVNLTKEDTGFVADSSYMYRICQNLMENALKYSAENTRIFIKTSVVEKEGEQAVRFEITNTSSYRMNFSKEQIVERFVRGDEERTSDGNGLGLAIANTYSAALGGNFDVNIDCDQFKAAVQFPKQEKSVVTAGN